MSKSDPFRILILGDLGPGDRPPLVERRVRCVDRDDVDSVMRTLAPTIRVDVGDDLPPEPFRPLQMDDLRVESLARNLVAPAALLDLRRRLADPATFAEAARECGCAENAGGDDAPPVPVAAPSLEEVLTASERRIAERQGDWDARVRGLVADEVARARIPAAPAGQAECLAQVDARLQARLRCVLRDPGFRALEASWLGVRLLADRLPTSSDLSLHVLDVSRDELVHDLRPSGEIAESALFRRIVEDTVGTAGAPPWALVVGLYELGSAPEEIAALTRMARLASTAEAPFVATARPRLFGCGASGQDPDSWFDVRDELERDLWGALRGIPEARRLALFWPPVLLRAPRGARWAPVEEPGFEELDDGEPGDLLCWGSAALVPTLLLGRAFAKAGWDLRREIEADLDGLPTVVRGTGDERELVPVTRTRLRIRAAEKVSAEGVVPLVAHADRATVRLGGLASLAHGGAELHGRWS